MMCQFHCGGTVERPNPWRVVVGLPRPRYHSNPMTCCCPVGPSVGGCRHGSCLHGNAIACSHEAEMLRHLAGSWPLWTHPAPPVPLASTSVTMDGYRRNGAAGGCRSNAARKSATSFSISAILGCGSGGPSSENPTKKKDQTTTTTTKTLIIRPWDDDLSSDPSSCSKEWHRSSEEDCDYDEDMEVDRDDDDYDEEEQEEEEEEEEIDVGGSGLQQTEGGRARSSSDCPLDALLRMTSQTHFLHQRFNGAQTTNATATIDYTSDDSGGNPPFAISSSKASSSNVFHRSSQPVKKRRKTRTAFTNHQIFQLEKRFLYQKYLTPADRDELALSLRLTNSQVITWFQNRRAKLKRDLEELKADVSAAKALGNEPSTSVLSRLDELIKANDSGLKKKDRNAASAGDTLCNSRAPIAKSPTNKTPIGADEETAVSSTTVRDTNSL